MIARQLRAPGAGFYLRRAVNARTLHAKPATVQYMRFVTRF